MTPETKIDLSKAVLNGNRFVKIPHVFIKGEGCFFKTLDTAIEEGTSPNGVGLWKREIKFQGETWFQAGNCNVWN